MRETFEDRKLTGTISLNLAGRGLWTADKATLVKSILTIVNDYQSRGYRMSLRQLYYQLVQSNAIPNHDKSYSKLSGLLDDCRYGGLVDWDAIEDRGRIPKLPYAVRDMEHAVQDTIDQYRLDRQIGQPRHIELWTEKDAISNILYRVTHNYHVRLVINKGYTSSSAAYQAYVRFVERLQLGQPITILYFGDHDPSGLDMVRDIASRMMTFFTKGERLKEHDCAFDKKMREWWKDEGHTMYDIVDRDELSERHMKSLVGDDPSSAAIEAFGAAQIRWYIEEHKLFQVVPIGLTMHQVKQYKLPPNPAKITDPRAADYVRQFGQLSWEVDALRPDVLEQLVRVHIENLMDKPAYQKVLKDEKKQIATLTKFIKK